MHGAVDREIELHLHQLLERRPGGLEAKLQVFQGLGCLCSDVTFADDLAGGIDGVLAPDDQRAGASGDQDGLGEGRVVVHAVGVEVLNGHRRSP